MDVILNVENVSKFYGNFRALKNVSFQVGKGQIVGLLGPNGSGKTTLIKLVNTLITEYSGEITVCGHKPGVKTKALVSYLPDVNFLRKDIKIKTAISYFNDFFQDFDKTKASEMLKSMNLDTNLRINTLSKGMNEKLQLALVMARQASLYIFDEPIAGVDPASRDFILNTIIKNYNEDGAILFSTHLISDVEPVISRVLFLKNGEIILDGDADELRNSRGMSVDNIFREEFRCSASL